MSNAKRLENMEKQIEVLRKMQDLESEAGFPNGDLWNDLEDKISTLKREIEIERKFGKNYTPNSLDFADKSNPIHY